MHVSFVHNNFTFMLVYLLLLLIKKSIYPSVLKFKNKNKNKIEEKSFTFLCQLQDYTMEVFPC